MKIKRGCFASISSYSLFGIFLLAGINNENGFNVSAFSGKSLNRVRLNSCNPSQQTTHVSSLLSSLQPIHVTSRRNKKTHLQASRSSIGSAGKKFKFPSLRRRFSSYSNEKKIDAFIHKANNLSPPIQLVTLIGLYIIHLTVLTQHSIVFPFQLIPNNQGRFQSIGLDSLAGIFSFLTIHLLRKRQLQKHRYNPSNVTIPPLLKNVHQDDNSSKGSTSSSRAPWNLPSLANLPNSPSAKITSMASMFLLVTAYFMTGRLAQWVELNLYALAGMGVPMTIAMHRSLVVLGGHLAWVAIGSGILGIVLRPQPFFGGGNLEFDADASVVDGAGATRLASGSAAKSPSKKVKQIYRWYTNKLNSNWVWWSIGGYFISSWFFNIADFMNQIILPAHVFEMAGEGVVSQLINPENNDLAASIMGYIAPCLSAPWWEEVLYRGFLLPALCLHMKFWWAVFVSGIVFSVHHVSTTGAIPLAILGWTWAVIYAKSNNLFVTIMIHAMWNSRVFLGSWLGL